MKGKERVFVLRSLKFKEHDSIVHFLNAKGAKLILIAKGGQKSQKRFSGGALDPTQYIEVTYTIKKNQMSSGFYGTLDEAQILDSFNGLRENYERLELGIYFTHLIGKISQEGVIDQGENFQLLGNGLKAAEQVRDLLKLKAHFLIKLLYHQGVLEPEERMTVFLGKSLVKSDDIEIDKKQLKTVFDGINKKLNDWFETLNIPQLL